MKEITLTSRMHKRDRILFEVMKSGDWYTLAEINTLTGYPSASASAGMRDFRKSKYGNNILEKAYLGGGIYKYRLIIKSKLIKTLLG